MTHGFSFPNARIQKFLGNIDRVTLSWFIIIIISIIIGAYSTGISTEVTREIVVQPLLIGVITLFSISLTLTIMGVQVASNRYTHRVDSIVIRKWAFWIHFLPHLIAILFAVLMLSIGRFVFLDFFIFIFFISASLLGIFPFLQWLLKTLSPERMLSINLHEINSEYLDRVEEVVNEERAEIFEGDERDRLTNIFSEMAYIGISDDDPVDRSMDIIRSRILNNDTGAAKSLIGRYSSHVESVLENRYQEFRTSHSESQLVYWYLLGSIEDLFQLAVNERNHRIAQEIISLQRKSIQNWYKKEDVEDVPEVFFRLFNSITVEYLSHCNGGQAMGIAREYGKISRVIASDIEAQNGKISGANISNFVSSSMAYAERAIHHDYIKAATLIRTNLRFIVDARIRDPPSNPERELLMIGLIGEMFASERAVSKDIVEIANETLVRDEAESTITTLVTFKDKIEESEDPSEVYDEILDKVMREIGRVNRALEERDSEIASKLEYDEDLVLDVIRGARLFRSPFTIDELVEEIDDSASISKSDVEEICTELQELGVLESREESSYMKSSG